MQWNPIWELRGSIMSSPDGCNISNHSLENSRLGHFSLVNELVCRSCRCTLDQSIVLRAATAWCRFLFLLHTYLDGRGPGPMCMARSYGYALCRAYTVHGSNRSSDSEVSAAI
jgi:hypothetical protein